MCYTYGMPINFHVFSLEADLCTLLTLNRVQNFYLENFSSIYEGANSPPNVVIILEDEV